MLHGISLTDPHIIPPATARIAQETMFWTRHDASFNDVYQNVNSAVHPRKNVNLSGILRFVFTSSIFTNDNLNMEQKPSLREMAVG
jgi:hypothetical protein